MSNYLNFNLFNSIAQQSKYDQKVATREREMEYVSRMEQRAEKRLNEQMMSQKAVNDYMEQVTQKIGAMHPNDLAKVRELEKQARQSIYSGIANSNGDIKQFLLEGGYETIRQYKNNVMQSDEVARGLANKDTLSYIAKAQGEGKYLQDAEVTLRDGSRKQVSAMEMVRLFEAGEIDSLQKTRAEEPKKLDLLAIAKTPNPNNIHESAPVSYEQAVNILMGQGQRESVARQVVSQMELIPDGQGGYFVEDAYWGYKDSDNYASWWYGKGGKGGGKGGRKSGKGDLINVTTRWDSLPSSGKYNPVWESSEGKQTMGIYDVNISKRESMAIDDELGLSRNKDGSVRGSFSNANKFHNLDTGAQVELKGNEYEVVSVDNKIQRVVDKKGNVQYYKLANVRISEEVSESKFGEGVFSWDKKWGEAYQQKEDAWFGDDYRVLELAVPIDTDNPLVSQGISEGAGYYEQTTMQGALIQEGGASEVNLAGQGMVNTEQFDRDAFLGGNSQNSSKNSLTLDQQNALYKQYRNNPKYFHFSDDELRNAIQSKING
jgi:hypothetical protein